MMDRQTAQSPTKKPSARHILLKNWAACCALGVLLAVVVVAVFGRVAGQDFVRLDDPIHIYANPYLQPRVDLPALWRAPYQGLYIPVAYTIVSCLIPLARLAHPDQTLSDTGALLNPHVFHIANLALHIANVILVFLLLRRLVGKDVPAAIGALIFAVHPLQVESVAWISEFRGLLSAFFGLLAILAYVHYTTSRQDNAARYAWPIYSLCIALCMLAILSKPSAVCVPILLFVFDMCFIKRNWRAAALSSLPLLLLCLPIVLLTEGQQPLPPDRLTPLWTRPLIATDALAFYTGKLAWPINLAIDYGRTPTSVIAAGIPYITWLVPAAIGAFAWCKRRQWPFVAGALLVSLAALSPVLGLIPFRFQGASTVADRYMYMAMLGPAIIVAFALASRARPMLNGVCIALTIVLACLSVGQVSYWDGTIALFEHSLSINSKSALLENNLGVDYRDRGQPLPAMLHFQKAASLDHHFFLAQENLADLLIDEGNISGAQSQYAAILSQWPRSRLAHMGLGKAYEIEGKDADALRIYDRLISYAPAFEPPYVRAGILLMQRKNYVDAASRFETAARLEPTDAAAWEGIGAAAEASGEAAVAANAMKHALALRALPHVRR